MDNMKFEQGGGGARSQHFAHFVAKIVGILNSVNQPKVKAFTLAEVLITLVIIGVVAALTIPSVVVSYQKHETVERLKKVYSSLAQTTNKAIADYGLMKNWKVEAETGNGETKAFVDKYMLPYLKVAKNCEYETIGECEFKYSYLDGSKSGIFGNQTYKLVLSDGSALFLKLLTSKKNPTGTGNIPVSYLFITVDINGKRKPNIFGRDIFRYMYFIQWDLTPAGPNYRDDSGTLQPNGGFGYAREDHRDYGCNKNVTGERCAALIMTDGWQIKDDYPW